MIEVEEITVRLGEQDYTIKEASHMRSMPWRKRLLEEIKPLFQQIEGAADLEFSTPADLIQLMPLIENILGDGLETVFEMLITYSPVLTDAREAIADSATDKQILAAFREVVRLADPFGMIEVATRQIGRAAAGISSSSPAQNGAVHSRRRKVSQSAK